MSGCTSPPKPAAFIYHATTTTCTHPAVIKTHGVIIRQLQIQSKPDVTMSDTTRCQLQRSEFLIPAKILLGVTQNLSDMARSDNTQCRFQQSRFFFPAQAEISTASDIAKSPLTAKQTRAVKISLRISQSGGFFFCCCCCFLSPRAQ